MRVETSQDLIYERFLRQQYEFRYKIFLIFVCVYAFLSGFVFVEPSPAEIWFLLLSPFLLMNFVTNWSAIFTFSLLFLPFLFSTLTGIIFGLFNPRFFIIDLYLFGFFFISVSYVHTLHNQKLDVHEILEKLMKYWALAGAVNVLFGLYAYVFERTTFFGTRLIRFGIRLTGFFKDPNVLGPFLVPIAVFFLMRYFRREGNSFTNLLAFLFFSFGILLTFSRAAWLNYLTAILIFLFMIIRERKVTIRVVLFISVAIATFLIFWSIAERINIIGINLKDFIITRSSLQEYDYNRFKAQREFVDIMKHVSVIFGCGPGNYEKFAGMATHSLYARYIGERGFFGFSLFVVFITLIWRKVFHSSIKTFLIPVILGQLVNSLFIDSLHWRHLWLLFIISYF